MREATSAEIETVLRAAKPGSLMVSRWTRVEFMSMLARNVRMNLQKEAYARVLAQRFGEDMRAAFEVYTPSATDFDLAAVLLLQAPTLGLRGADALHLAAAQSQNLPLYTLDKTLLRAAQVLGVPASDGGIT